MKKGDLKRNSILKTAEALFLEKGYDQTSVQDILDALTLSKGGFYHHFASKEQILQEICEEHVEARFSKLSMELYDPRIRPTEKLNRLLAQVGLFDWEEPRFAAMLLKICYRNQDVRMREYVREMMMAKLLPYMEDLLAQGLAEDEFFVRHPGRIGRIVLNMAVCADDEACRMLASSAENPERVLEIAELLDACCDAVETLLGASFGTVRMFEPARLISNFQAAIREMRQLEA